jgi:hypothetical protein
MLSMCRFRAFGRKEGRKEGRKCTLRLNRGERGEDCMYHNSMHKGMRNVKLAGMSLLSSDGTILGLCWDWAARVTTPAVGDYSYWLGVDGGRRWVSWVEKGGYGRLGMALWLRARQIISVFVVVVVGYEYPAGHRWL